MQIQLSIFHRTFHQTFIKNLINVLYRKENVVKDVKFTREKMRKLNFYNICAISVVLHCL